VLEITELYSIKDVKIYGTGQVVKQKPEPGMGPSETLSIWLEE
jgi:hypothetical protein